MLSLQDIASKAVVLYGCWKSEELPGVIRCRLDAIDEHVATRMTGSGFVFDDQNGIFELEVGWSDGIWSLAFRQFVVGTMTEIIVEVKAGRETFLSSSWAVIFGVDHTSASFLGFTVKDVKANMSRREVTFVCSFSAIQGHPESSNKFNTVFQFSPTGYSLMIKTMHWDQREESYVTVTERYLEKMGPLP